MKSLRQTAPILARTMPSYFALVILYTLLIFILPTDKVSASQYNFTPLAYKVVFFGVSLPYMLVWLTAFAGYDKLGQYAQAIRKTSDGAHFKRLASGCKWLAWSLPVSAIVTLILTSVSNQWPGLHAAAFVLSNYVSLALTLAAFTIIGGASRGLLNDSRANFSLSSSRIITFIFVVFGVLYCYFTFQHFDLSKLGTTNNPYFLPVWLSILTITIPYLYAWFVGLLAAYEINLFSKNVRGILYRQATRLLVAGLITVLVSLIALQYIVALEPRAGHLVLDFRLVLVLLFQIIGGIGFALVTFGALKLKRIEEV